jgi:hypothetical protein
VHPWGHRREVNALREKESLSEICFILFVKLGLVGFHMQSFRVLYNFHDRLIVLARAFVFDRHNCLARYKLALYGSMIELVGSVCVLIEAKRFAGIPSVFRAFLEATVELQNLLNDEGYLDNMKATWADQWLKVLRAAKAGKSMYLNSIPKVADIDVEITWLESQLNDLKMRDRAPLNVFVRFQRAGMAKEYYSLYNFLSCDAHSNIRVLISRHLKNDFELFYYKDIPEESLVPMVDKMADLLLSASRVLHDVFETGKVATVEEMLGELKKNRELTGK